MSPELRARVLDTLGTDGPKIVRRARQLRVAAHVGGLAITLAAFGIWRSLTASQPALPVVAVVQPDVRPCSTFLLASENHDSLDLKGRGRAVTFSGGSIKLVSAEACRTVIELTRGGVAVHAQNLGGGELGIRTPEGEIWVKGTKFSVEAGERRTRVSVVEGLVAVRPGHSEAVDVRSGESLEVTVGKVERVPITTRELDDKVTAVLDGRMAEAAPIPPSPPAERPRPRTKPEPKQSAVQPETPVVEPSTDHVKVVAVPRPRGDEPGGPKASLPVTPEGWVMEAESLRKSGKIDAARAAYREVASRQDGMGEAALLRLADLELESGAAETALTLTLEHQRRFPQGSLRIESLWASVRAAEKAGKLSVARRSAQELVQSYPNTPYGKSAATWLAQH